MTKGCLTSRPRTLFSFTRTNGHTVRYFIHRKTIESTGGVTTSKQISPSPINQPNTHTRNKQASADERVTAAVTTAGTYATRYWGHPLWAGCAWQLARIPRLDIAGGGCNIPLYAVIPHAHIILVFQLDSLNNDHAHDTHSGIVKNILWTLFLLDVLFR